MPDQSSKELSQRFKDFTRQTLRRKSREAVRLEGRLFKRRAEDPLARITREDFMTPTSLGATMGLLEIQWVAVRAGGWWNRRYYLVAVRVVGNILTQELYYELIEYRFAGIGKFQRDPQRRKRRVAMSQPYDPTTLSCLDDLDKHWTGSERRFAREQVLERFKDHLRF
jgi:hypothetical protein